MASNQKFRRNIVRSSIALRSGASLVAICAVTMATSAIAQSSDPALDANGKPIVSGPASAGKVQNAGQAGAPTTSIANSTVAPTPAGAPGEIVVTGIRQSLANAQNIKRNSDTVVDAITAQDIGALPDRSVTEALQRVPGVSMNRFAGSNDPDHFSVEGSGVVVRGLNFVRSEFNGRDTFSANGGQAINFSDVPAELLGSVEVYKNATADMIEGGLAGTVNLNTRVPFDKKGLQIGVDLEANYGDMRKKWTPTGSILVSNTWETGIGRIGLLADVSYSRLKSRSDGIQVTNFQTRDASIVNGAPGATAPVCRNPLPSNTNTTGLPPAGSCTSTGVGGPDGFADLLPLAYAPIGGSFRTQDYDRTRKGLALAAQWQSLDQRATLTGQFLRTDSRNKWGEHTFETAGDLADYNTYPAGCQYNQNASNGQPRAQCPVGFKNYQYDANNVFESGYITYPGGGWRGFGPGNGSTFVPAGGIQQSLSRRQVDDRNVVSDYGLNLKFNPTPRWAINLDADYTKAKHNTLDFSVFGSTFADQELDLTGQLPVVVPHKPLTLNYDWNGSPSPLAGLSDAQYFSNPNVQFWRAAMDHIEQSDGHEWAFKGDVGYNFENDVPFLRKAKFGARYADRQETVRSTTYNWGALSEVWAGNPVSVAQAGAANADFYTFPDFFRGKTPGPIGGFFYNGDLIGGYDQASTFFKQIGNTWKTTNGATGQRTWVPLAERANVIPGTPFLPGEIQTVGDKDINAYAMLNFGQDDPIFGNVRLDGNVGVRFVDTKINTFGNISAPSLTDLNIGSTYAVRCATSAPPTGAPPGTVIGAPGGICAIGPVAYAQLQQFANGAITPTSDSNHYRLWLPSLNLKFGLSRDVLIRFAASKVMTRPDLGYIRPSFGASYQSNTNSILFQVGNPRLKPATAWQFDLTGEWYFARVGSLTVDVFYKTVKNFFYQSTINRSFTNNGVTENIDVRGPANFNGSGKIKGVEVAFQRTFDFLPGILSGFGVAANYSYIKSRGLPNNYLGSSGVNPNGIAGNLPLEQLSKHNVNATLFYEKGRISLRAAYNWRSRFLLTSADVIYPYYPIYNEATGQLDASAFFNITKNVKIGVQGVNLLNEVTKTSQQFTLDGMSGPRSYFMNDRRYSIILRGNF